MLTFSFSVVKCLIRHSVREEMFVLARGLRKHSPPRQQRLGGSKSRRQLLDNLWVDLETESEPCWAVWLPLSSHLVSTSANGEVPPT